MATNLTLPTLPEELDFLSCWQTRSVGDGVMGPFIKGENLDAFWTVDEPRAYYTWACLSAMVASLAFQGREAYKFRSTRFWVWFSFCAWQWTIVLAYLLLVIGGMTRTLLIFAWVHNAFEFAIGFNVWSVVAHNFFWATKRRPYIIISPVIVWSAIQILLTSALPLEDAYLVVIAMGFAADLWLFVWMLIGIFRRRLSMWPVMASTFHQVYAVLVAFNCAFAPWGRFFGLLANTFAIVSFSIGTVYGPIIVSRGQNTIQLETVVHEKKEQQVAKIEDREDKTLEIAARTVDQVEAEFKEGIDLPKHTDEKPAAVVAAIQEIEEVKH